MFNKLTSAFAIGSFAVCAAIAGTLISAPKADAAADCVYGQGYQLCFDLVASSGSYTRWNVQMRNNHTVEKMIVDCNGKSMDNWKSRGGATQSQARYMANYFCSI